MQCNFQKMKEICFFSFSKSGGQYDQIHWERVCALQRICSNSKLVQVQIQIQIQIHWKCVCTLQLPCGAGQHFLYCASLRDRKRPKKCEKFEKIKWRRLKSYSVTDKPTHLIIRFFNFCVFFARYSLFLLPGILSTMPWCKGLTTSAASECGPESQC